MNIIIEGPDGSGKSTLAEFLASNLHWPIVHSPGPPASQEEFEGRVRVALTCQRTIFDRHPIISETVYGQVRGRCYAMDCHRLRLYGLSQDVRIFSAFNPPAARHVTKTHDTLDHLELIHRKQQQIALAYAAWAFQHAHVIYNGDVLRTLRLIKGAII